MCTHSPYVGHREAAAVHSKQSSERDRRFMKGDRYKNIPFNSSRSYSLFRKQLPPYIINSRSSEVDCVVSKVLSMSPGKCKHILCLFLACFAISARAEVNQSETATFSSLHRQRSEQPISQISSTVQQKKAYVSLSSDNVSSNVSHFNVGNDGLSGEKFSDSNTISEHNEERFLDATTNAERSVQTRSHDTAFNESNGPEADKAKYFIMNIFRRYGDDEHLLVENVKKLLRKIGLVPSAKDTHSHTGQQDLQDSNHNNQDHELDSQDHEPHDIHDHEPHSHEHDTHDHEPHSHEHDTNDHEPHSHEHDTHDHEPHSHDHDGHLKDSNADLAGAASGENYNLSTVFGNHLSSLERQQKHSKARKRDFSKLHQNFDSHDCMSTDDLLRTFGFEHLPKLEVKHFLHLCSALIDQLDAGVCHLSSAQGHGHHHDEDFHSGHDHTGETDDHKPHVPGKASAKVWVYTLLSVAIISLCSIAGIVVIPNMKRTFYNHILQFLVALAVGAMSGDSMLHLLPHALLSESHHGNHHRHHHHEKNNLEDDVGEKDPQAETSPHMAAMYKGLVALIGIYSFFFLERLFTLFTKNRSGRRKKKQKRRRRCPDLEELNNPKFHMVNSNLENNAGNTPSCDDMVMVVHANKALKAYADVSHEAFLHRCDESLIVSPSGHEITGVMSNGDQNPIKEESVVCSVASTLEGAHKEGSVKTFTRETVRVSDAEIVGIIKESELPSVHTHSHSHSHVGRDFRGSISSVAMMVVIGDIVHNFCDGLAIGAAFAGSIAGGLSTSVAVFCHELPHEIGDFAVLIRSGLTVRKAVYFNLFTSIPCFIGAIIGLAVGNLSSTSLWIFAAVGGMFLYITLVDLIPEMSSVYTKCGEPWFLHLLLQGSGIAMGTTIMLIISVSEESLLTAFED